jgi:alkylation response protein AidB-like acyl-CoA dehydrogenase
MAVDAALEAIQIHGGYGYMEELGLEKLARDAKLLELGAGTTDINLLAAARELIGVGE